MKQNLFFAVAALAFAAPACADEHDLLFPNNYIMTQQETKPYVVSMGRINEDNYVKFKFKDSATDDEIRAAILTVEYIAQGHNTPILVVYGGNDALSKRIRALDDIAPMIGPYHKYDQSGEQGTVTVIMVRSKTGLDMIQDGWY